MKTRLLRMLRKKAERTYKVAFIDGWWQCFEKKTDIWEPLNIDYLKPRQYYNAWRTKAEALQALDACKRQYIREYIAPLIRRRNWKRLQRKIEEA